MNLQVRVKLRLSKESNTIRVKYNTFEKATFDEYLVCSAILNSKNKASFDTYVDEITGNGSLNAHFKKLYQKYKELSQSDLESIMANSMIPVLKIDEKNRYDFYPQLNISVYRSRIYSGNLMEDPMLSELLQIEGSIVGIEIIPKSKTEKSEPYDVTISDEEVHIKLADKYIPIGSALFSAIVDAFPFDEDKYDGRIRRTCDGEGWNIVTPSFAGNLLNEKNVFIDENSDHCTIRNTDIQVTQVAKVIGTYIYKQISHVYKNNEPVCIKAISKLYENNSISGMNDTFFNLMFENINDGRTLQVIINDLLYRKDNARAVQRGLKLVRIGIVSGWSNSTLKAFLKVASAEELNKLYPQNQGLDYKIEQLLQINPAFFSERHLGMVEQYNRDLENKRSMIRAIIGDVTTSGLRERAKKLVSDPDTKRFSKLCNDLIGHVEKSLDSVDMDTVIKWEKDALELKQLSIVIEKKLSELK